jgi:2-aminoadipate transaminase
MPRRKEKPVKYHYSSMMDFIQPLPIAQLLNREEDPGQISFANGFPDPATFPVEELRAAFDRAFSRYGANALQYAPPEGLPSLREKICGQLKESGIRCELENVLLTQGGSQALDLIASMFLDRGDTILCENPTYTGAMGPFDMRDVNYIGIDVDQEGMDIDQAERALAEHPEVKFIYVIPDFQNPTGATLSLSRRRRLLELAETYDMMIVEDSPYRELCFGEENLPSLKSMDRNGRVILLGTYSKILCPGLRLGWVVASKEIVSRMTALRIASDMQCSSINMYALDEYFEEADFAAHIRGLRRLYSEKKQCITDAMRRCFPKNVRYTDPQGGIFLWLTLPPQVDAARLLRELVLPREHVAYLPGEGFYCRTPQKNTCRLNFSGCTVDQLETGIERLGRVFRQVL